MFDLLKNLCAQDGCSGDERAVTKYIISQLPEDCAYKIDGLGNLIVTKKGMKTPKNKIMLAAHMDEVGFIVTYITEDGYLKFAPVGGVNAPAAIGRQLHFRNGTVGVIGTKAMHQMTKEEREKDVEFDDLMIDIGATDREQAQQKVMPGDCAYFDCGYTELGSGMIKSKAIDDRIGCAILLLLLKKKLPFDITCVFTVQEEIGARGAKAASYTVKPDYAMVIEATTACDFAGVSDEKRICELSKGVVISYMDKGTIYSKELYNAAFAKARELKFSAQTKTMIAGGNDSSAISVSAGGIPTIALSVPCRYLHTPSCMINKEDALATASLAAAMFCELCEK
ncbi:MAG: M20/M25/M40 family metallo-hydrolase [Eubacterium sp.]|nr:M20/M25/M40 family metallo-hydrolase [Eubacterium sp.]